MLRRDFLRILGGDMAHRIAYILGGPELAASLQAIPETAPTGEPRS